MKNRSKLVTGYILVYIAIAWVFLSSFIPQLMSDFIWIYMILIFGGIGELTSYRKNRKKKLKRFRVGKEENKYIKWLFIELAVGILILIIQCILENVS